MKIQTEVKCFMQYKTQKGLGLLEILASLVVFSAVTVMGIKAYQVSSNIFKEAKKTRELTQNINATIETISGLNRNLLLNAGSAYLNWSDPTPIGHGDFGYSSKVNLNPMVDGKSRTDVAAIEIQYGPMANGKITKIEGRNVTLIPNKNTGESAEVTQENIKTELEYSQGKYNKHIKEIESKQPALKDASNKFLNPYNCYDPGECCGVLDQWARTGFNNKNAIDGLPEKCDYRCFQSFSYTTPQWDSICGIKLCEKVDSTGIKSKCNTLPEGSFQRDVCNSCGTGGCEACCADFENIIKQGLPKMPEGYVLNAACPEKCVADWIGTGNVPLDYNYWFGVCGKENVCADLVPQNKTECCANGGGITMSLCQGCGIVRGGTCESKSCGSTNWLDDIDCKNLTWCGNVPNLFTDKWEDHWGNIYQKCKNDPACLQTNCDVPPSDEECCLRYYLVNGNDNPPSRYHKWCPSVDKQKCCKMEIPGAYCDGVGGQYADSHVGRNDWKCSDATSFKCKKLNFCGKDQAFKPIGVPKTCQSTSNTTNTSSGTNQPRPSSPSPTNKPKTIDRGDASPVDVTTQPKKQANSDYTNKNTSTNGGHE